MSVKEVKLEVSKEVARGFYSNMALLVHTKDEFVMDFAFAYPGQGPFVGSRVITSPQHAKALLRSLEDNVRRYEARHGEIKEAAPRKGERIQN